MLELKETKRIKLTEPQRRRPKLVRPSWAKKRGHISKFSPEMRKDIIKEHKKGGVTLVSLARKYKVTPNTIGEIVAGKYLERKR